MKTPAIVVVVFVLAGTAYAQTHVGPPALLHPVSPMQQAYNDCRALFWNGTSYTFPACEKIARQPGLSLAGAPPAIRPRPTTPDDVTRAKAFITREAARAK